MLRRIIYIISDDNACPYLLWYQVTKTQETKSLCTNKTSEIQIKCLKMYIYIKIYILNIFEPFPLTKQMFRDSSWGLWVWPIAERTFNMWYRVRVPTIFKHWKKSWQLPFVVSAAFSERHWHMLKHMFWPTSRPWVFPMTKVLALCRTTQCSYPENNSH